MKTSQRVRDRMSTSPVTVTSYASLQEAFDLMLTHNVRELPVVDKGMLIGIVTDRDLREISPAYPVFRHREEISHYLKTLKVADAMTPDPLVVDPDTPLVRAASMLLTYKISSLPVVEKERLVGIISVADFLELFVEQNQD